MQAVRRIKRPPLSRYHHLLVVDRFKGIYANILYVRRAQHVLGSFMGYAGGGVDEDGDFWIDPSGRVELTVLGDWRAACRPAPAQEQLFEQLSRTRTYFERRTGNGWPSAAGMRLSRHVQTVHSASGWTYCSPGVSHAVLQSLSCHPQWPLSMSWS